VASSFSYSRTAKPAKIKCIRKQLYVFFGDIFSRSDCPDCTRVAILQFKDAVEGLSGGRFDIFLKP
jgi:hypothetical protein